MGRFSLYDPNDLLLQVGCYRSPRIFCDVIKFSGDFARDICEPDFPGLLIVVGVSRHNC